ncbi:hypothetical protein [Macrococcus carouselicus]|nr:hypothetical protein [Macrococcus carouselicus]
MEEGIIEDDKVNACIEELEAAANAKSMKTVKYQPALMGGLFYRDF